MDRRAFLAGTGAVLLAAPLAARAQPTGRLPRIGVLGVSGQAAQVIAFRQGLEELGYVEGQTSSSQVARSLRVELRAIAARGPEEFEGAFAAMRKLRVGGLLVLADGVFVLQAARLVNLSAESHLPTIYGNLPFTEAGGLMSYQGSFVAMYRRAASVVDKILLA